MLPSRYREEVARAHLQILAPGIPQARTLARMRMSFTSSAQKDCTGGGRQRRERAPRVATGKAAIAIARGAIAIAIAIAACRHGCYG